MSRRKRLPFVMTLRLDRQLAADLENLADSESVSRAALIRRTLRLAVARRSFCASTGQKLVPNTENSQ